MHFQSSRTAPYVFTKLMRPLIRLWRGTGLKAIIYLDDGIVSVKGEQQVIEASAGVRYDLEKAGFVVNVEKSMCNNQVTFASKPAS